MFQFRQFPTYTYGFSIRYMDMTPCGFPHSEIPGSKLICSSPRLIAAYHVFLRLPVPRHSPCALLRLTVFILLDSSFANKMSFPEIVDSFQIFSSVQIDFSILTSCLYAVLFSFQGTDAEKTLSPLRKKWWAQVDSNHRPRAYQARALTT